MLIKNGDRVRMMTDEELADLFVSFLFFRGKRFKQKFRIYVLEWLKTTAWVDWEEWKKRK